MIEVRMQPLTETMLEGTIVQWLKREGESVREGEPLLEVETDKAVSEVNSPASGVVSKLLCESGQTVAVGAIIAYLEPAGMGLQGEADRGEAGQGKARKHEGGKAENTERSEGGGTTNAQSTLGRREERVLASPAAKRIAKEKGIALEDVEGRGSGGLITESDVLEYAETAHGPVRDQDTSSEIGRRLRQSQFGQEEVIPLEGIRKRIAERMAESRRTAADVTTFMEADVTELMHIRKESDASVTAFVVRAAALGLREFPVLNSSLEDDGIVLKRYINVGVAVAGEHGLVVPVIRDADRKTLREIASELRELASKARERKISAEDVSGGTFTVTNSGVFGSFFFTPIINYPESAILGIGAVRKVPAVVGEGIAIRSVMYLCLSYDHRVVDGAPAVQFLAKVRDLLGNPGLLI